MSVILAEVLRSRGHGHVLNYYENVLLFRWLWSHLHWWGVLVFFAVTGFLGLIRNALSG